MKIRALTLLSCVTSAVPVMAHDGLTSAGWLHVLLHHASEPAIAILGASVTVVVLVVGIAAIRAVSKMRASRAPVLSRL